MGRLLLDPFQVGFMQRALAAALLVGVLGGVVGVFVVLRRLQFVGDALTHTVFPGVVVAFLTGRSILLGALVFGLLTAVLLTLLTAHRRVTVDAGVAILLTSFFALGVVLVSRTRGYTSDLSLFLFGRILAIGADDLLQMGVVAAVVLAGLLALRKELLLRAFDPDGAAALGYRTVLLDLALNVLVALVVVAGVKAVGTVLVVALIMVPAATARLLTERLAGMTVLAAALGALGGWVGLAVSYEASLQRGVRLAAGATIVVVLVGFFLVALAARVLIDRGGSKRPPGPPQTDGPRRASGPPQTGEPRRAPGPPRTGGPRRASGPQGASGSAT